MNRITCISGWAFKPDIFANVTQHFPEHDIQLIDLCDFDINTYTNQQNFKQRVLIGWSLGGLTALQLCHNYPNQFTHLILLSSTPRFKHDTDWYGMNEIQIQKQLTSAKTDMAEYLQTFLKLAIYPEKSSSLTQAAKSLLHSQNNLSHLLENLFYNDMRQQFSNANLPILQIIGEKDLVIRPKQSTQAHTIIDHTINSIPNAGHLLPITHSQQVAALIKEFLC